MDLRGKKLGLLVSAAPARPNFQHALRLAETALDRGVRVYFYCIDDAVTGLEEPRLQAIRARGASLFACAYAMQRRGLPLGESALFSGLGMAGDILAGTDRFLAFN